MGGGEEPRAQVRLEVVSAMYLCILTRTVTPIPMYFLHVRLFATPVFKELDAVRYLHNPVGIPFLTLLLHFDVSCVVLTREESDEGADRSLHCGVQVGLSTRVSEQLIYATSDRAGVRILNSRQYSACCRTFGDASFRQVDHFGVRLSLSRHVGP